MDRKIKILMVLGNTGRGGAQTFVINLLRIIDKERFQIDFVVNKIENNGYENEIKELGSDIFIVPFFRIYNTRVYLKAWDRILKNGHYDIVHGHVSSSASVYLKKAKEYGCVTIAHSHSAGYRGNKVMVFVKKLFSKNVKNVADYWFACSDLAASRLFGTDYRLYKNYYDIPNAILSENYRYDVIIRDKIRKELKLSDKTVLYGHIGSFTKPKNHLFLLDVFEKIHNKQPEAKLILIGGGELKDEIINTVVAKHIDNYVIFSGVVGNVNEYLMAMDKLIFPSFFEGFPITVIEAEASGLYSVISDTITNEVIVADCVKSLPLSAGADEWSLVTMEVPAIDRFQCNDIVNKTNYNMKNTVKRISDIYLSMTSEE